MREGTDEYWVGRAINDPEAFAELVERYQSRIFSIAMRLVGRREDASDITQETFLRAYRNLNTFRLDARFSPWIHRIAVNLCLNHRKSWAVRPQTSLDENLVSQELSPERRTEANEIQAALVRAIDSLPTRYRAAVVLRHVNDLSYEDIAVALGVPLGTVKTWLFRARELLQVRLSSDRSV